MTDNYGRDIDTTNGMDSGNMAQVPDYQAHSADYIPALDSNPDTRKSQEELLESQSSLQRMSEMLKSGSSGGGKSGGTGQGSFSKRMKSLFKRDDTKKKSEPFSTSVSGRSLELEPQQLDSPSTSYAGNPSEVVRTDQSRFDAAIDVYRAKSTHLVDYSNPDIMELKEPPEKEIVRMSTIINTILVLALIAGIIMTALSSYDEILAVIGPCFIVLSSFALLGKLFFTLFWEEEPCPLLRPYITAVEDKIGGEKDPYNLQGQTTQPASSMYQYGNPGLSGSTDPVTGQTTAVYRPPSNFYSDPAPVVYDPDLETRPQSQYSRSSSTEAVNQGKYIGDYPDGRSTPY